ncbi:oxytocin receptor-like isoform X2 [Styela clava]|uniref:oxytocin receptor-like isoform X2 n=1 Tax=Styela clava TaxID=7725 RepID=UPI00193A21A4|nr:oxytocin receptor-like isoform X2 [Styela clava]
MATIQTYTEMFDERMSQVEPNTTFNEIYLDSTSSPVVIQQKSCPPPGLPQRVLTAYYIEIAVLTAIFICAMFGNSCVLLAVYRRRAKSTRMHLFIVHLAVADIIVALFQVLPEILMRLLCGFHAGDAACRLVKYLQIVGMYGSTYVLVCTAMDRYLAIRYPMQTFKQSKKRVHVAICMAWLLSMILSTPQLFFFGIDEHLPYCRMYGISTVGKKIYVTWYFISVLALPVTLLTFFYGMIAFIIFKNLRQKRKAAAPNSRTLIRGNGEFAPRASNVKIVSQAKIKTVKMTFVIVILFALCYTPFFTVQLLSQWNLINRNGITSQVIHILASLNSCVNPWVYMGFSGHLLGELKQAFFCGSNKRETQPPRSFRSTMTTNVGNSSITYAETSQFHGPNGETRDL